LSLIEQYPYKNILVLGGNGFIGSHLVDILLEKGFKVKVFDLKKEQFREQLHRVEYYYGTFSNTSLLSEALNDVDVVFHLIHTTMPSISNYNIRDEIDQNILPTLSLLELIKKQKVKKLIYLSSGGAVYGNSTEKKFNEQHLTEPISSYGIVKLMIEKYIKLYARDNYFKYIIFRPSNPYGIRQSHYGVQGIINTILHNIILGKQINIWGDGSSVKDYIYVNDLVQALIKGINFSENETFNVGSGTGLTINEIIDIIGSVTKKKFDVIHNILDINKIKLNLKWDTSIQIEDGIEIVWHWLKKILVLDN